MTASNSGTPQRRTIGLTVVLLAGATLGLAFACVAVGEEVLTLPESRDSG